MKEKAQFLSKSPANATQTELQQFGFIDRNRTPGSAVAADHNHEARLLFHSASLAATTFCVVCATGSSAGPVPASMVCHMKPRSLIASKRNVKMCAQGCCWSPLEAVWLPCFRPHCDQCFIASRSPATSQRLPTRLPVRLSRTTNSLGPLSKINIKVVGWLSIANSRSETECSPTPSLSVTLELLVQQVRHLASHARPHCAMTTHDLLQPRGNSPGRNADPLP